MKHIKVIIVLVFSTMFVSNSYADSYRANCLIFLINEQTNGEWNRRVSSNVVSAEPVIIKQGAHVVSLEFTIEPPPSTRYSLTVSLMTNPSTDEEISTVLISNTYDATLVGGANGPFEFEEELNGLKFGGAIALSHRVKN